MKEKKILNDIMMLATKLGHRLFRNNVALAWAGKISHSVTPGALTIFTPRPIHSGLCTGSSDLIGWTQVEITQSMVGKKLAVFTAYEIKTKNVATTEDQRNFIDAVNDSGGIGRFIRSIEEAEEGFLCFKK